MAGSKHCVYTIFNCNARNMTNYVR
ncbi:hypothetical protein KL86PLE_100528 [uncultured Pleomorphomonas sp.]|uniref:Uncharacterized protein n=1 Tax=uncultured Pleomorphomonas sp. TaxID=442121 RepID=A0A212L418_9HYPH|nr:hypothetical protein KL86PLE_100528 [uncultured Pleomorphomonas sp.]